jgi:hypothetical protein
MSHDEVIKSLGAKIELLTNNAKNQNDQAKVYLIEASRNMILCPKEETLLRKKRPPTTRS